MANWDIQDMEELETLVYGGTKMCMIWRNQDIQDMVNWDIQAMVELGYIEDG